MFYIFLSIYLFCCSFSRNKRIFLLSNFLVFLFLSGAYCYGYDWIRYKAYFDDKFLYYSLDTWIYEPLFMALYAIVKPLGLEYHWVVVLCAGIIGRNIYVFSKEKVNPNFALFFVFSIFCFMEFMEQLRQGVAISFILLAYSALKYNDKKSFYINVMLATAFHISAVLCLFFIPLNKLMSSNYPKVKVIVISALTFAGVEVAGYVINNAALLGDFFIFHKLSGYSTDSSGLLSFGLFLNLAVVSICVLSIRARTPQVYVSIVASIFVITSKSISIVFRFSYYGYVYVYDAFEFIFLQRSKVNKFAVNVILLVFALKPFLNPVYFAMLGQYNFFWIGWFFDSVDVSAIVHDKCSLLSSYDIKFCGY